MEQFCSSSFYESSGSVGYLFTELLAPVAQTCSLSVSVQIVTGRVNLSSSSSSSFSSSEMGRSRTRTRRRTRTIWLRLGHAALYRRFLTCHLPPASNVLPITNRRYGRLKICATLNRYLAGSSFCH